MAVKRSKNVECAILQNAQQEAERDKLDRILRVKRAMKLQLLTFCASFHDVMRYFDLTYCLKITQNVAFEILNFVLLKLTCLVTLFDSNFQFFKNSPKWTIFGIFN